MAAVKLVVQTAKKIKFRASQRLLSSKFRINRKTVGRAYHSTNNRAFRKDRLGQRDIQMVQQFYRTEHIARPLPQKRFATKHGPGYVLQITLKAAFRLFQKEHPSVKISYTKFTQLRPKNVRLLSAMKQEGCLCAYCMNVKYKLLSLNKLVAQGKLHQSLKIDERDLVNKLLCPKSEAERYHNASCIWGKGKKCKDYSNTIKSHYQSLVGYNSSTSCVWNHWERKKSKDNKVRRVLETKEGSVQDVLSELIQDIEKPVMGVTFVEHSFIASWQYFQYNQLKAKLPENWVLMVMDFAQNRKIIFQDEIKSAHFAQKQVTVHPIIVYRQDDNDHIIREALVFLSGDNAHDSHAVEHFLQIANKYLTKEENVKISKIVIYSDGCASQ